MKILILLRALSVGGAERRACLIARGLRQSGHSVTLAVFYGGGTLEPLCAEAGVRLIDLQKRGRSDIAGFLLRYLRMMRQERPEVVYSFLLGPNLLAALTGFCFRRTRLVWALCASRMEWSRYEGLRRWLDRLERLLSRIPGAIISNSHAGRNDAVAAGYPADRLRVVHNGFDTDYFRPDPVARRHLRADWGMDASTPLFGLVGRFDPMKGHAVFLEAAALCLNELPAARFILIGTGASRVETGPGRPIIQLDHHPDMPAVYNALDVLVSASVFGEGLSNAVGEAMASGTPCVVTDVGDSALLVGDYGQVVAPSDPAALAAAMLSLWRQVDAGTIDRAGLRARIVRHFGLAAMIAGTEAVLRSTGET
jgi:glycosyltransferase involved in cell wall biosynthesis